MKTRPSHWHFLDYYLIWEGPLGSDTWAGVPGLSKPWGTTNNQCSSQASASVPASGFPPWLPSVMPVMWKRKPNKPFPPQVAVGPGVHHGNRNPNEDILQSSSIPACCAVYTSDLASLSTIAGI